MGMKMSHTNEQNFLEALSEAITRLRLTRNRSAPRVTETKGSGLTPPDHTTSRGVAGTAGTTGGTRSITC
jgi:hypothetical protein